MLNICNKLKIILFALIFMSVSGLSFGDSVDNIPGSYGDPIEDKSYGQWFVFSRVRKADTGSMERFCYMISYPQKISDEQKYVTSQPFLAVSRVLVKDKELNKLKASGEVNLFTGNTMEKPRKVIANIDNKHEYKLFDKEGYAWTESVDSDKAMITSMKRGVTLRAYSKNSSNKNFISEEFSLMGFSKAYVRMFDLCKGDNN